MTFSEANALHGNPFYGSEVQYSVNCQSCVVANELRRLGFDVHAFGNSKTKGYTPFALSHNTNAAWADANGVWPAYTRIRRTIDDVYIDKRGNPRFRNTAKANEELMQRFHEATKEEGRYFISWDWKDKTSGHIVTAERLKDGTLRIYDPQTGRIMKGFDLKKIDLERQGLCYIRVDNRFMNADVARGVVKKFDGYGGNAPLMDDVQKAFWRKAGVKGAVQGEYKPEYEPLTSPNVSKRLRRVRDKDKKLREMKDIVDEISNDVDNIKDKAKRATLLHVGNNGYRTIVHPGHKMHDKHWQETFGMAKALNRSSKNVAFLPEHSNKISADAITVFNDKPCIADFKYSATSSWNTLQKELNFGFSQADVIILKLENMDAGGFRNAIEYLKRNGKPIGNIILMNRYNEIIELPSKTFSSRKYVGKIKGFLK